MSLPDCPTEMSPCPLCGTGGRRPQICVLSLHTHAQLLFPNCVTASCRLDTPQVLQVTFPKNKEVLSKPIILKTTALTLVQYYYLVLSSDLFHSLPTAQITSLRENFASPGFSPLLVLNGVIMPLQLLSFRT